MLLPRPREFGNEPDNPRITVWTELLVPPREELDTTQWAQYFQPLVQHPDHRGSVWARVQERPNIVILENLGARGIVPVASYEVVYFSAPMTEAQRAQISQLKGICPPAMGFSIPHRELDQSHHPEHQEVQLILWPHFWQDAKKAEYRNSYTDIIEYSCVVGYRTIIEDFSAKLEEVGPVEWKEEFCDF
ncbi:uncharacterized protein N7498_005180 [Penicillium cinerascens]|uniref:Uncharacterized protein n=1 Tax=Penicillium cinerascens TaxID=70096 RepID=A0A9W9MMY5_9EURO|nr:uncharacterized protein N7498_005180 [Penicillium cinerascens]KAJ5204301.1 hypothetical protein N7498_005180 [Penicillium cinerascens]